MTDALNKYSHAATGEGADGTKAAELGVEGRLFKRTVGSAIANNAIPTAYDVITVAHKNDDITPTGGAAGDAVNRFIAYSNVANVPDVTTYDAMNSAAKAAYSVDADGRLNVTLPTGDLPAAPEVFRFQPVNAADVPSTAFIAQVGSGEVGVKSATVVGLNTVYVLDHIVTGTVVADVVAGGEANPFRILAKPSAFLESYFESTKDIVEGVDEIYYSNKIVVREIKDAAKRESGDATTAAANSINFTGVAKAGGALSEYGLNAVTTKTNWIDERTPSFKIGYDETNQNLTFDGLNKDLGKGTGIGFDSFTVYSKKLDSGTNGLGVPSFGENPEIDLTTDNLLRGSPFVIDGPDVRAQNKRYGMQVEFDTVANNFNITSGTTGEALAANSAVGVPNVQSALSIAVGRYGLDLFGARDATDDAAYAFNKIGKGTNTVMGFPRDGVEGFTGPTGLVSRPAISEGGEGLMDMTKAFTVTL